MQRPAISMRLLSRFRRWSRVLTVAIVAICIGVLIGWNWDIDVLKTMVPGLTAMNPMSAICFLLLITAYFLFAGEFFQRPLRLAGTVLSLVVLLIALLKGAQLFNLIDWSPDQWLFTSKLDDHIGPANAMAPNTVVCFILSSLGLIFWQREKTTRGLVSNVFALILLTIGLLSLLGYLYHADHFYGFMQFVPMALHTGLNFFLFALVLLFSSPHKGIMLLLTANLSGSTIARRLIPAAIIVPSFLGVLRLWGSRQEYYSNEFGVALYAVTLIVIFVALIAYTSFLFNQRDLSRRQLEFSLQDSESRTKAIFDNAPDPVILLDHEGGIERWNTEAVNVFGWSPEEAEKKKLQDLIFPGMAGATGNTFTDILQKQIEGNEDDIDLVAFTKDGRPFDVALRLSPVVIGERKYWICFLRNISERKKTENILRPMNEELRKKVADQTEELSQIFEKVQDSVVALDSNYRITYVNKVAGEMGGYKAEDVIGKSIWEMYPSFVGTDIEAAFKRAMETKTQVLVSDYYEPLDIFYDSRMYPTASGILIFTQDVTLQRRAEREINQAKSLADRLIDSLPGVFYFYDINGKFIRWNKRLEEVTGYSAEEIAAMHPSQLFPDDEKEYITGRIMSVFETGMNDAQCDFQCKDGTRIPYYFKAVKIEYKGMPCLLGNGMDITEQKKAEEELIASSEKYRLLFASNPLPMWMLSLPDYNIIEVNESALMQYGYTREEFLDFDIFDLRPKREREKLLANTNRSFRGLYHAGVWEHLRKDGSTIFVDITAFDIIYEGKPTRLILAVDTTERYEAEEKLKESFQSIKELTEHLQNIREEERLHMAREIHDELGQLLTVIKMDISWVKRKMKDDDPSIQNKVTDLISTVDKTVVTVRRIASELRPSLLDNLGLLAAMEWHLEEFTRRSEVPHTFNRPEDEPELPENVKIGLFRILQESLTNVGRHAQAKNVHVVFEQTNDFLFLEIADDGKGFDPEKRKNKTLGLLGMKERAEGFRGEYTITSAEGQGTTITVKVPVSAQNAK